MQKPDIYDPAKRYIFTNWSDEDFSKQYANPDFQFTPNPDFTDKENKRLYNDLYKRDYFKTFFVKKGGMVEVPEWLAFFMVKHFVDREFIKGVVAKYGSLSRGANKGEANDKADSEILNMNSPAVRDELEDRTIKPLNVNEESPIITALREEIRQEERAKLIALGTAELEAKTPVLRDPNPSDGVEHVSTPHKRPQGRPRKEFAEAKTD